MLLPKQQHKFHVSVHDINQQLQNVVKWCHYIQTISAAYIQLSNIIIAFQIYMGQWIH